MRMTQFLVSWVLYGATSTVSEYLTNLGFWLTPFIVSHKRFLDAIPLTINHELIYGFIHPNRGGLHDVLFEKLGINGAGASARCEELLREPPNVQVTRESLLAQYDRLSAAAAALEGVIY